MIKKIRRVVTGHDAQGRSTFIFDGIATCVKELDAFPGHGLTDLWETTTAPADNTGNADAVTRPVRLEPPRNGSIFRIVELSPDSIWKPREDSGAAQAFASIGAAHTHVADIASDPMRHKTSTIDYIIVLEGEIYAVLDTGEILLKPGDVLVHHRVALLLQSWFLQSRILNSGSIRGFCYFNLHYEARQKWSGKFVAS